MQIEREIINQLSQNGSKDVDKIFKHSFVHSCVKSKLRDLFTKVI